MVILKRLITWELIVKFITSFCFFRLKNFWENILKKLIWMPIIHNGNSKLCSNFKIFLSMCRPEDGEKCAVRWVDSQVRNTGVYNFIKNPPPSSYLGLLRWIREKIILWEIKNISDENKFSSKILYNIHPCNDILFLL